MANTIDFANTLICSLSFINIAPIQLFLSFIISAKNVSSYTVIFFLSSTLFIRVLATLSPVLSLVWTILFIE